MEAEERPQEENNYNPSSVGYIPQQAQKDLGWLNQHLKADEVLNSLKMMLLGFEYDNEEEEWNKSKIHVEDENGKIVEVEQPPLMPPEQISITIGYLKTFLNSNTYLSTIEKERINDIMWDINLKLMGLFYYLRRKISPETRDMIWGMIEYPILMGLSRAQNKITLDAASKTQHSFEHKQIGDGANSDQQKKDFKIFGF